MEKRRYFGYWVYSDGRIYGIKGKKFLSEKDNGIGYKGVGIFIDGIKKRTYVHRIVATVFILNPEDKPCVNHKDGNKANNCVDNLEWVSYKANCIHGLENKLIKSGCSHARSSLSPSQIKEIRHLRNNIGYKVKTLSKRFEVSDGVISGILRGKTYKEKYGW